MTSVDWSKAPAWAKSLCLNPAHELAWLGDEGYSYLIGNGHMVEWTNECAFDHSAFKLVEARPTPWDGQGLPPVGVTCEYKRAGRLPWKPVTVFAHKPNTNGSISVLFDYVGVSEWGACADPSSFRLPLTPEQIAAEERKKTIQEMLDVDQCGTLSRTKFCNLLYDAGYRKLPSA